MIERPDVVTSEHIEYLDELRESGEVNMGGAGPYIQAVFNTDKRIARIILKYWRDTFPERHSADGRTP